MSAERAGKVSTGGCQCGAVRYRLTNGHSRGVLCHCRMCQKVGGSPFMAFVSAPKDEFDITHGRLTIFASSEIADRGFCSSCGTPLTYQGKSSAHISVTIGSLDDPAAASPNSQLGVESRLGWLSRALESPEMTADSWVASKNIADIGNHQHPDHET